MNIVIASGKGGTGKTTVSTNLVGYISEALKNTKQNVVLTDIDVEEPNSGIFIHGKLYHSQEITRDIPHWDKTRCTFCKKCSEVCNFNAIAVMPKGLMRNKVCRLNKDILFFAKAQKLRIASLFNEFCNVGKGQKNKFKCKVYFVSSPKQVLVFSELCHACYACSELCPEGALPMKPIPMGQLTHYKTPVLDFVEGKLNIGEQQATPMIEKTMAYVNSTFPKNTIKIFDAPPGTSCPVIESVKNSDMVILVAEPTPFGVHDFKLSVETMKKLGHRFTVVINKHGIGDNELEKYCTKENIDIIGKIPNMRTYAEHYSKGKMLYQHFDSIKKEMEKIFFAINANVKLG